MPELVPLGTNGFFPSGDRQTMSFLLLDGDSAVLLDAGSGVCRLLEPALAERLAGIERLDVFLTHYHLDHVIGLSYLSAVWRNRPVRILAPQAPLVDVDGPRAALDRLLSPPLFPLGLDAWPLPVEVVAYGSERLALGPWSLALRRQQHPGGSVGIRVDDLLAYVTDTVADEATVDFAGGVDLLLHEVWWTAEELGAAPHAAGHASDEAVAELAKRAGVRRLAAVHHRPDRSPAQLAAMERRLRAGFSGEVVTLVEGEPIELREP